MKHTLLILATAALLFTACTVNTQPADGPNYTNTVTGFALTTDSLDPIPNLVLDMTTVKGSYTTPVGGKTVRTDSTGHFEFIYTGPANGQIGIGFGGSYSYHNLGGYDYITPFTTQTHNIHLQPYGWLKLHVKNVTPWNGDDALVVSVGSNYEILYGVADKTIIWKTPGNSRKEIRWSVYRDSVKTIYSDSIYILGFDTTFYEIFY